VVFVYLEAFQHYMRLHLGSQKNSDLVLPGQLPLP
jgi:hypothetical protein